MTGKFLWMGMKNYEERVGMGKDHRERGGIEKIRGYWDDLFLQYHSLNTHHLLVVFPDELISQFPLEYPFIPRLCIS